MKLEPTPYNVVLLHDHAQPPVYRRLLSSQGVRGRVPRVSCVRADIACADAGPDCNVWFYRAVQSVETVLQQGTPFTHAKVALWQATIVENALKRLAAQNKPFKYVGKL